MESINQVKIDEIKEIRDDALERYFEIVEEFGICKKANDYADKVERLNKAIKELESDS